MKKLAIIVGHEEEKKGAFSGHLNKHEYDFWYEVALSLWKVAKDAGLDAQVFLRNGISIEKVGELVNLWCGKEGVALELHFNSSLDTKAHGLETLYDQDKAFAEAVHKASVKSLPGIRDRGLKLVSDADRGHRNLKAVKVASCLLEPFFGSNINDCKLFLTHKSEWMNALVDCVKAYKI